MGSAVQLVVFLLWSLAEVHSQTVTSFKAVAAERSVFFSWSAPNVSTPVTGYNLSCSPLPATSLPLSFTTSGTYTVLGFYPDTSYNCSLVAYTAVSTGHPAIVLFSTTKDCEQMFKKLSKMYYPLLSCRFTLSTNTKGINQLP